jgi:succinate dehydrogenase / fumarate reductase cytochrome b subunit
MSATGGFWKFLNSSIGKKILMALTGLFLCSFLVVHLVGNFQLFKGDEGMAFNQYAVFMTTNPLIKTTSYLLYFTIIFHAFWGLYLAYLNKKARPIDYHVKSANANSSVFSRNMGILGTIILIFIVTHMKDFWFKYKFGELPYIEYTKNINTGQITTKSANPISEKMLTYKEGDNEIIVVKDLYKIVSMEFKELSHLILYVLAMFALSFHLIHGFKSGFQSLGINHSRYNGIISAIGIYGFGLIIPLSFAAMPIYFFFK